MKNLEDYEKEVLFLVEANDFERHCLWEKHHETLNWESVNTGQFIQVGTLDNRPINLCLDFAILNGVTVGFWYPCSQVVDHKQIEKWMGKNFGHLKYDGGSRQAQTNATNFHHVIHALEELLPKAKELSARFEAKLLAADSNDPRVSRSKRL